MVEAMLLRFFLVLGAAAKLAASAETDAAVMANIAAAGYSL